MRFEEERYGWKGWLNQADAGLIAGVSERTFRRLTPPPSRPDGMRG